jgi:cytochrome c peroxidase
MSIIGSAYAPWLLWDGHKDSLWAQAIEPIEAVDEHGSTRLQAIHLIANDEEYRRAYEEIFGPLPDLNDYARFPDSGGPVDFLDYRERWQSMERADQEAASQVFANVGKAIAAYEQLLTPGVSRFDTYVEALLQGDDGAADAALTAMEVAGLRLFIGEAGCVRCHDGPLFSDFSFHNTGVPPGEGLPGKELPADRGRAEGWEEVIADEFNCASVHAGVESARCGAKLAAESVQQLDQALDGAFRTPMLRSVTETAPYMHAGQFADLAQVLNHYTRAPQAVLGSSELVALDLSPEQAAQLEAFLHTLQAAPDVAPQLLAPPK